MERALEVQAEALRISPDHATSLSNMLITLRSLCRWCVCCARCGALALFLSGPTPLPARPPARSAYAVL